MNVELYWMELVAGLLVRHLIENVLLYRKTTAVLTRDIFNIGLVYLVTVITGYSITKEC